MLKIIIITLLLRFHDLSVVNLFCPSIKARRCLETGQDLFQTDIIKNYMLYLTCEVIDDVHVSVKHLGYKLFVTVSPCGLVQDGWTVC